jgi:hypothetical protein
MTIYKLTKFNGVIRSADNAFIPFDPANTDYAEYLKFLAEGGQPLPADDNGQTDQ